MAREGRRTTRGFRIPRRSPPPAVRESRGEEHPFLPWPPTLLSRGHSDPFFLNFQLKTRFWRG